MKTKKNNKIYMKVTSKSNSDNFEIYSIHPNYYILIHLSAGRQQSLHLKVHDFKHEQFNLQTAWNYNNFKFDILTRQELFLEML